MVMDNLKKFFHDQCKEGKKILIDDLNKFLDELRDDDFFGTEGQCDPRGDNRD
jgi:hypothetical protein